MGGRKFARRAVPAPASFFDNKLVTALAPGSKSQIQPATAPASAPCLKTTGNGSGTGTGTTKWHQHRHRH